MMMKNSNSVTPDEYFNYFCTDALAVKHHFSNQSGVDALEEHIEYLERRIERQEEGLMTYERFVEELLRVSEGQFPASRHKQILELLENLNIEY
jgi:hypothetical protein